jgi:plastocyanin
MPLRSMSLVALLAAFALGVAGCGDDDSDNGGGGSGSANTSDDGGGGGVYGGGGGGDDSGGGGGGGGDSGDDEQGGPTAGSELKLAADPGGALKFDKTSLSAKPGSVTVVLDNPSDVPHAIEVEGEGVEEVGETVGKGGVSKVTADLEAGEYEYYCPVGNHKDAGMEGTLTVG